MAFDTYLIIDKAAVVKGETTAKGLEPATGWIEIFSFSWGASNPTTVGSGKTGMSAGKVSISSFNIMKKTEMSSAPLFAACAAGQHFKTAQVVMRKATGESGGQKTFLSYDFKDIMVESIQWSGSSGGDDSPTESVSFAFAAVDDQVLRAEHRDGRDGSEGQGLVGSDLGCCEGVTSPSPMPTARELYTAGRLDAAIETLGTELRSHPLDAQRRSFLFELLSFAGQYDRAAKQLGALASAGHMAEAGTMVYRAALEGERVREHMFATGDLPGGEAPAPVAGTLNGQPFASIEDADPRVGARLELFAGGRYLWLPFAHVASLRAEPPTQLRDMHWLTARVATGPSVRDLELGEVLLPLLTPAAWRHADPDIRLGRATDWDELPDGDFAPIGQKVLRVDDRLVPLIDVRELTIEVDAPDSAP